MQFQFVNQIKVKFFKTPSKFLQQQQRIKETAVFYVQPLNSNALPPAI